MSTTTDTTDIWKGPPNWQASSPFFSLLPFEVRENIFCYTLSRGPEERPWILEDGVDDDRLYIEGQYGRRRRNRNPPCMHLLLVCKRWHDEITPLVYTNVHLKLHLFSRAETQLFRIHPNYLKCLRTMLIEFEDIPSVQRAPTGPHLRSIAERVTDVLRLCKQGGIDLRRVDFLAPWHGMRDVGTFSSSRRPAGNAPTSVVDTLTSVDIDPLFADTALFSTFKSVAFIDFDSLFATRVEFPLQWTYPLSKRQRNEIVEKLGFQRDEDQSSGKVLALRNPKWTPSDAPKFLAHTREFQTLVDQHDSKLQNSGVDAPLRPPPGA